MKYRMTDKHNGNDACIFWILGFRYRIKYWNIFSNKSTVRSTAIKLLLNHHLDVNVKNKAGKMAHQLLPEGDSDRKMIQEIIDKKGRAGIRFQ